MQTLVEWQKPAPNGLVYPWWTHPLLDVLEQADFSRSTWLEFGAGRGTAWLRSKCRWVDTIETSDQWAADVDLECREHGLLNGSIHGQHLHDGVSEHMAPYFAMIPDRQYDVISVDGIFRDECLQWALDHFKGRGGLLIVDNLDQDYVWISEKAMELMKGYPCEIYYQPFHIHHEGRPWNTRLYLVP